MIQNYGTMVNTEGKGLVFRKEPLEDSIQVFKKLSSIHAVKYVMSESSLWIGHFVWWKTELSHRRTSLTIDDKHRLSL